MKKTLLILVLNLLLLAFAGCKEQTPNQEQTSGQTQTSPITQKFMEIKLSTEAFKLNEKIPDKYSCKGEDVSPYLKWEGTPENTKTFALILYDPDAPSGNFTHWLIYNIPATQTELSLDSNTNKDSFEKAIVGHILGRGKLEGTFVR